MLWYDTHPPPLPAHFHDWYHPKFMPRNPSQHRLLLPVLPCDTPAQGTATEMFICLGSLSLQGWEVWRGFFHSCKARDSTCKGLGSLEPLGTDCESRNK